MLSPQHETPPPPSPAAPMGERLTSIKARVRAAFDTMAEVTVAVPRADPALARRLRAPLGQLVAAGQLRDTFDQRVAHVETAHDRAPGLGREARSAVFHVTSLQLVDLARLIEQTAQEAGAAFRSLGVLAESQGREPGPAPEPAVLALLARLAREGLHAVADLAAASEILGAEAEGHAARVERAVPGAAIAGADLGWMTALYTMDGERRVHRMAMAQAAEAGA